MTSAANERSWSTVELIAFLSSRISPRVSTVIFCDKSPCAIAIETTAMLRNWAVRLLDSELTSLMSDRQLPDSPSTLASTPSLPSVRISRTTCDTPVETARSWRITPATVSASARKSPWTALPSR